MKTATTQVASTEAAGGVRMRRTMPRSVVTANRPKPVSAYQRARAELAGTWGVSPDTVKDRLNGGHSIYDAVAEANTVLLQHGLVAEVAEKMLPVEASVAGARRLSLDEALHRAELADTAEQLADETFREKRRQGTATIADAEEYLRKSAAARYHAEQAEQEVLAWITEQKGGSQ